VLKIRIEMDENVSEEIIIKCNSLSDEVLRLQQLLTDAIGKPEHLILYKGNTEYYLELNDILFFETESSVVMAHTAKETYETSYKLYELEDLLPGRFLRVSKGAIVNASKIYSINRNLTSSSAIEFSGTYKTIYVSRGYYKSLKEKLEEMRYRK